LEVLQLQPQKRAKQSHLRVCGHSGTFTCLGTMHWHYTTPSLQNGCIFVVAFLDHEMLNFMPPCCLVLTRWTFFIRERN